jgi:bile acid:Na+ symporter, BASS family
MPQDPMTAIAFAGVILMMFSVGLELTTGDFRRVFRAPFAVSVGMAGQLLLLPAAALGLALLLDLPSHIAIGLMILAACPGGSTSNAFTYLARGDVALSVSLTTLSSCLAFLTTPTIASLGVAVFGGEDTGIRLSFVDTSLSVLITTITPVAAGMLLRARAHTLSRRLKLPSFVIGLCGVLYPSIDLIADSADLMAQSLGTAAFAAGALNVSMVAAGLGIAAILRLPEPQGRAIALEIGLQNYGLAVVLILNFLQDPRMLLPGLFYLPCMLLTGVAVVLWGRRRDRTAEADLLRGRQPRG